MRLHQPEWLLCLISLPLLALIFWLARKRRGQAWKKLLAPRLQGRLSRVGPAWLSYLSYALALFGLAGLIIALAQPEAGEEWIEVESEGRNLLFCIDISRSMLAEDTQPNRLQASRAAALEILEKFPNDRVGVLLYAGENLIQSPLTLDHSFVEQTLAQLDPADIPYGGSNLSGAIDDAVHLLTQSGQQSHIMVVFSDGENSTGGVEAAAARAAKEGVFIYALGMGSPEGAFIPDPRHHDGKFRDRTGSPVFTQLNEEALQTVASKTQGIYSRGMGADFLRKLDSALSEMDRFREEGKHQRVAKPAHQWFLLSGLVLLMLSICVRILPLRSVVALFAIFLTLPSAEASFISDGREALDRGDSAEAYQFFRLAAEGEAGKRAASLHLAAGSAAFQAKSWEAAADSFSEALASDDLKVQQQAHYGLATSLFYLGVPREGDEKMKAWQGAVEQYEAALVIDPNDSKASKNLEQVRAFLRQVEQEKQEQEQNQEQKQEGQKSENEKNENEDEDEQEQNQGEQGEEESPEKDEGQNSPGEKEQQDQQGEQNENPEQDQQQSEQPQEGQEDQKSESENSESGEEEKGSEASDQESQNQDSDPGQESANSENENGEQKSGNQQETPRKAGSQSERPKEGGEAEPLNESREERARRLLKQYADFGGKAPRRVRRPFQRAAQDW